MKNNLPPLYCLERNGIIRGLSFRDEEMACPFDQDFLKGECDQPGTKLLKSATGSKSRRHPLNFN